MSNGVSARSVDGSAREFRDEAEWRALMADFERWGRFAAQLLRGPGVADAQDDVDAFTAQHDEGARRVPVFAFRIGRGLLAAGRAEEALEAIDAGAPVQPDPIWQEFDWLAHDLRPILMDFSRRQLSDHCPTAASARHHGSRRHLP